VGNRDNNDGRFLVVRVFCEAGARTLNTVGLQTTPAVHSRMSLLLLNHGSGIVPYSLPIVLVLFSGLRFFDWSSC